MTSSWIEDRAPMPRSPCPRHAHHHNSIKKGINVQRSKFKITGLALPKRIYVRWQSLVEPQTYSAVLNIPESARQLMLRKAPSMHPPTLYEYQEALAIGLAPGGWIKAWVMSLSSTPVEILCQRAQIEPKGPFQGLNRGHYAYSFEKLEPATQQYIKTHPIPYDSWKCPHSAASTKE